MTLVLIIRLFWSIARYELRPLRYLEPTYITSSIPSGLSTLPLLKNGWQLSALISSIMSSCELSHHYRKAFPREHGWSWGRRNDVGGRPFADDGDGLERTRSACIADYHCRLACVALAENQSLLHVNLAGLSGHLRSSKSNYGNFRSPISH